MRYLFFLCIIAVFFMVGCSGGGTHSPMLPEAGLPGEINGAQISGESHTNWGLWQFVADPAAQTLEAVQLRTGQMHLNALNFVDQPFGVYLIIENIVFNGNKIDLNVGLRHPFIGLVQYTGFDVKGILISDGGQGGFTDPGIHMPGVNDTRLLNPDGLTRWWNPVDFPTNDTIFGYSDGALGTPNSIAGFTGTINGFKYFCDDLNDPNDPLSLVDPEGRGMFSAGVKNTRHYTIQLGTSGLVFNYAVDANWKFPVGNPPFQAPDDFEAKANQPEAYRVEITETENTLYYDPILGAGGDLHLSINVYDWFSADLHTLYTEWPGVAVQAASSGPVGGGVGYSTYQIDINDFTPIAAGAQDLLITVASEAVGYQGLIPGAKVSSYFKYTTDVAGEPPPTGYTLEFSDEGIIPEVYMTDWDEISPALCVETDGDIKMAYNNNKVIANDEARSYAVKSADGLNWTDYQVSFYSWGGVLANHGDCTKVVADKTGNSWRTLALFYKEQGTFSTPFTAATELFPPPVGIDGAHVTTYMSRAPEIIQDALGYIYVMGDQNGALKFKKSVYPNYLTGPAGDQAVWSGNPLQDIAPGYFSRARSSELGPDGKMYIIYYLDDTSNVIKLAFNTDDTGLVWDTSTVAYDGASTTTTGAHDPGIDIDPNGEFHVTFIRHNTDTDNEEICYIHSADGVSWSNAVVISAMPGIMNDDPVCFFQQDGVDLLAAVWLSGTHIFISYSSDGGDTWADATQVDSLLPENAQPDFVVTADGVMHIAWAAWRETNYDIHYRNAWLVAN